MKVLLQWSRQSPKDWEEIDSSQWKALPKKPLPVGTETIDDSPGYVHYLNIQGVIFTADHYVVDELRDGSGGIRVYAWNDDSQDYADGEFYARVWTFLPLAPDSSLGGAINTRQTQVVYAQSELLSRMKEGLSAENTEYRPWEEFLPPDESITRHGIWVTDVLNNRHVTSLSTKGWREWGGGGGRPCSSTAYPWKIQEG